MVLDWWGCRGGEGGGGGGGEVVTRPHLTKPDRVELTGQACPGSQLCAGQLASPAPSQSSSS